MVSHSLAPNKDQFGTYLRPSHSVVIAYGEKKIALNDRLFTF